MTINEAYLVALRATVTLTYIPEMAPGFYDTFPWHPETFPGHIRLFLINTGNDPLCLGNVPGGPGNVS